MSRINRPIVNSWQENIAKQERLELQDRLEYLLALEKEMGEKHPDASLNKYLPKYELSLGDISELIAQIEGKL
jgi:pantothenate kinase-related protein Tda10